VRIIAVLKMEVKTFDFIAGSNLKNCIQFFLLLHIIFKVKLAFVVKLM
jgi:hypothetical protein